MVYKIAMETVRLNIKQVICFIGFSELYANAAWLGPPYI